MKTNDTQLTTLLWVVLFILTLWLAILLAGCYDPSLSLANYLEIINDVITQPFRITFNDYTLRFMLGFSILYGIAISAYYASEGRKRDGEEHGSAHWGSVRSVIKQFGQNKKTDLILTKHIRLGLDTHRHRRNLNVVVVGGSGSGKTRFYAKPNILQCNTSFVITDPKSEMLKATGHLLKAKGYDIKVLNLINFAESDGYNPFQYLRDDKDVIKLINNLIKNTTPKSSQSNDPFWEKAETALLQALMFYLIYEAPTYEQNFGMVMTMLEYAGASEDDETFQTPLDILFRSLERETPSHIAVKQYKVFKQAAGKTAKSILVSCAVRLAAFNLKQIQDITQTDELDFANLAKKNTAIFAVIPDNDTSFNYIVGMLYTQVFQELYYQADHIYGGALPTPVHMIMDEFANVALPDEFDKILSTMRSRGISASIIIQNLAQLKGLFKSSQNAWETIVGNCVRP